LRPQVGAAAGLPCPQPDHAETVVRLALAIMDYVKNHDFSGRRLIIRIGISSGPVVAGIIGHRKFSYDLWGYTVNTASRMESCGTGGAIQISESTYRLISDKFICEPQGTVNIKGKGELSTWFVTGEKDTLS
jgi:adenylate cyclase